MATNNAVNNGLSSATGTGLFVGSTSPTITTPVIAIIKDANGNNVTTFTGTASAVNYVNIVNAATGNSAYIEFTGSDALRAGLFKSNNGNFRFVDSTGVNGGLISLRNAANTEGVQLRVDPALATTTTFQLPSADGSANAVMQTDGAGNLSLSTIVTSGTYTPTAANTANITSITPAVCQYMRIGNVVTVSGVVSVGATAAGTFAYTLTLPVSSTFSGQTQCSGLTGQPLVAGYSAGRIVADTITTNTQALVQATAGDNTARGWSIIFTYLIV